MIETVKIVVLLTLSTSVTAQIASTSYLPFRCGFESSNLCGCSHQRGSDFYWSRGSRYYGSSTSGTGPSGPYSGSYFLYTEANYKDMGDKAYLRTPKLNYEGMICVSFYYHMRDSSRSQMGTLKVFTTSQGESCPLVNLTGHQNNYWKKANVQTAISSGDMVVFLGIRGNGTKGDIALDSMSIIAGTCTDPTHEPACDTANKTTVPMNTSIIISAKSQRYTYTSSWYGRVRGYENVSIAKVLEGDPSEWVPKISSGSLPNVTRYTLRNMNKLGLNFPRRSIVWSDSKYGDISYGSIDNDVANMFIDRKTAHYFASPSIGGIAVDWVANNLYWTDKVYKWVMMTKLQNATTEYLKVISTDIEAPIGICVHPAKSYLFWSDTSSAKPKIERSDLLGGARLPIVKTNIQSPIALDIDYKTDRLYWVDKDKYLIASCLLDGSDRKEFLEKAHFVSFFIGMTIYNNYLFSITGGNQLYIMDTSKPTAQPKNITLDYNKAYDIIAFGADKQENITSPCSNIECEGICVGTESNTKAKCVCPEGKEIYNGKSCLASRYFSSPMYALVTYSSVCMMDVFTPESYNAARIPYFFYPDCNERFGFYTIYNERIQSMNHLLSNKVMYVGTSHNIYMRSMISFASTYLLIGGAGDVKAISVDWIAKNIYWTDGAGLIKVANYRGKYRMVLVKEEGVAGLVVDPTTGYMYWSNPLKKWIKKAKMDGSNPTTLMSKIPQPGNLTMDYIEQRLYWTAGSQIYRMKTDGSNMTVIVKNTTQPYTVAVFKNHIVWTGSRGLSWTYKEEPLRKELNVTRHSMRMAGSGPLMLYGEYSQPNYTNKCATKRGGCAHMCISLPNTVMCKCGLGFDLDTDKKSCKQSDIGQPDMIITTMAEHKILAFNSKNNKAKPLPLRNVVQPAFIAFDAMQKMLFWVDFARKDISQATLTGKQQKTILTVSPGRVPYGLAVDPKKKRVFYGIFNRSISSMDYDGKNSKVIIWSAMEEGPLYLTVDIYYSKLYWSNWGKFPGISMADYDGRNKKILVDGFNMLYPTGLFLDTQNQVLYWCDSWIGRVESINTDGKNRKLIHFDRHAAYFGLTSMGDYLYVTDQNSSYIKKIPKTGGSSISNLGDPILPLGSGIVAFDFSHPLPPSPGPTTVPPPTKPEKSPKATPTPTSGNSTGDGKTLSVKDNNGLDFKDKVLIGVFGGVAIFIIVAMTVACLIRPSRTAMLDKVGHLKGRMSRADSSGDDTRSTSSGIGTIDNMYN